jgi:hypothetical protein
MTAEVVLWQAPAAEGQIRRVAHKPRMAAGGRAVRSAIVYYQAASRTSNPRQHLYLSEAREPVNGVQTLELATYDNRADQGASANHADIGDALTTLGVTDEKVLSDGCPGAALKVKLIAAFADSIPERYRRHLPDTLTPAQLVTATIHPLARHIADARPDLPPLDAAPQWSATLLQRPSLADLLTGLTEARPTAPAVADAGRLLIRDGQLIRAGLFLCRWARGLDSGRFATLMARCADSPLDPGWQPPANVLVAMHWVVSQLTPTAHLGLLIDLAHSPAAAVALAELAAGPVPRVDAGTATLDRLREAVKRSCGAFADLDGLTVPGVGTTTVLLPGATADLTRVGRLMGNCIKDMHPTGSRAHEFTSGAIVVAWDGRTPIAAVRLDTTREVVQWAGRRNTPLSEPVRHALCSSLGVRPPPVTREAFR